MQPTSEQLLAVIRTQTDVARKGLDLDGVMEIVAGRAMALTDATGAAVEMLDGDAMVYRAAAGSAEPYLGLRIAVATSLSGRCVRDGETLHCRDSETDPRVDRAATRKVGAASMVVVPLVHGQRTVGVLKVLSSQVDAFGDDDVVLLELLSGLVAAALHHAAEAQGSELFRRATMDDLTGLANRALFRDRLSAWTAAERDLTACQVAIADLDGMKTVNDRHGHLVGDVVLKEVANRLVGAVRRGDTVARIGGDEFGILLRGRDGAEAVLSRIAEAIDGVRLAVAPDVELGISVGVATYPDDAQHPDGLIAVADKAMYAEKAARGRQRRP